MSSELVLSRGRSPPAPNLHKCLLVNRRAVPLPRITNLHSLGKTDITSSCSLGCMIPFILIKVQSCWRKTVAAKAIFVSVKQSSKNHYHMRLPFPIPQASGTTHFRSKHCFTKITSLLSESSYLLYDRRHLKLKAILILYSKKLCFKKTKEKNAFCNRF